MNKFEVLQAIVENRRSIKPAVMNGKKIDDQAIQQLLELASWAPTHGLTEPWRFIVYSGNAVRQFCHQHAELYKQVTPPEKFNTGKYEKQQHNGDKASHLIAVYMQKGTNPNIPELEDICAAAAAVQNILLGAEALGLAVLWSTGGLTLHPAMAKHLNLEENQIMLGLLYIGQTDEPARPGKRQSITEKTKWVNK